MSKFIDLDRRFRELTAAEREDPANLAWFRGDDAFGGEPWAKILESERVVILAEAGAGKTKEMEAQAARLTAEGHFAFFVPVEALGREGLAGFLSTDRAARQRFADWQGDPGRLAWFFIDAVDELKLADGKLSSALGKLASELGDAHGRARIFVSCRPTDWRPVQDLEAFRKALPTTERTEAVPVGDEGLLAPFEPKAADAKETEVAAVAERCVVLLPLAKKQIEKFARERGVSDPAGFMAEVRRRDAWPFARRPLDLQGLLDTFQINGKLGSRREQHEADISLALRDDPDRADQGLLTPELAIEGVERLALAMFQARTRTLSTPELAVGSLADQSSLDAEMILDDWSPKQVRALLRRAIFDPATYGRVRFHHRSIQEFLAARRLSHLLTVGMPEREIRNLLFAGRYGEKVLIPSMRPVAAWLAASDANVASEILQREPETLVNFGDPESLAIDIRIALVRAFVAAYGGGTWRGLEMPIDEVRRLAHRDLAPVIREVWATPHENDEVWDFLLKLIWLGEIDACSDLALKALRDPKLEAYTRVVAGRALLECGRTDLLTGVAKDMVRSKKLWPDRVVHSLAPELFPDTLDAAGLHKLIKRTPEPKRTVGGFSWHLMHRSVELDAPHLSTTALRKALADLIWANQEGGDRWHARSRFGYLCPTLARLVSRQIDAGVSGPDIIRAAAIANHFRDDFATSREELAQLRASLEARPQLRERTFWIEIELARHVDPKDEPWHWVYRLNESGLLGGGRAEDRPWLIKALAKAKPYETRRVALEALLWGWTGSDPLDHADIRKRIADDQRLNDALAHRLKPREEHPNERRWRERSERQKVKEEEDRIKVRADWQRWSAGVRADPASAFTGRKASATRWTLYHWLGMDKRRDGGTAHLAHPNWARIREVVSDDVGARFEASMKAFWRRTAPPLHSGRPPNELNRIYPTQGVALTALQIEASTGSDWAKKLSPAQARRAAEWATLELNGFPEWLATLWDAHPKAVSKVFETEIGWELKGVGRRNHTHVINSIRYGAPTLAPRAAAHFLSALRTWPAPPKLAASRASYLRNLDDVTIIVSSDPTSAAKLADIAERRFARNAHSDIGAAWLKGLAMVDLRRALKAMQRALKSLTPAERRSKGVMWLGTLFGDRGRHETVSLDVESDMLLDLTKLAYECVRPEDDNVHEGAYSPDPRDEAESARNRLIGAVIGKPGPEAHAALTVLSKEPLFAHLTDRLRRHARERASIDSERAALSPSEIRTWERQFASPPKTRDDLFRAMFDRLEDIRHEVLHHDFNDRQILERLKLEEEMQPRLAMKFEERSAKHYSVAREEVVAGKKETDIRLVVSSGLKAVAEIKIGDRYSVAELLDALENQLVKKYLRHASCSAGCLLITYGGRKGFDCPKTGQSLSFAQVVELLSVRASELEAHEKGRIRVGVFGLDLRDPLLAA